MDANSLFFGSELFSHGKVMDYGRVLTLPDAEFAEFRRQCMLEYFAPAERAAQGLPPEIHCGNCHAPIARPERLYRYFGQSLDAKCFSEVYTREQERLEGHERQYFDRVLRLIPSS